MRPLPLLLPLLLAAACGAGKDAAPWNTDPGIAGHTWFPLAGTAHEPTPVGSIASGQAIYCASCHVADAFRKMVDCRSCHFAHAWDPLAPSPDDMAPHTGNAAYVASRDAVPPRTDFCIQCHPQGMAYSALNHTKFPIGAGTKHNRACSVCHLTSGPATTDITITTSRSNAVRYDQLACVACHTNTPPFVGVFPPPDLATRHALVLDYPASPAPRDCMRCHDPTAMAPSAGAGNLVLHVVDHGSRPGPPGFASAGPWDGKHGNAGSAVRCWSCHGSVPPLFPNAVGPSGTAGPWAQDWSVGPPANACTYPKPAGSSQVSCCTDCHGVKN